MRQESHERWALETAKKHAMPKAKEWQGMTPEQLRDTLPVRVLSLARATQRRELVSANLRDAGGWRLGQARWPGSRHNILAAPLVVARQRLH